MLKVVYSLFLGIILAIFVGVGISAFYQAPQYPDPPDTIKYGAVDEPDEEYLAAQRQYDEQNNQVQQQMDDYSRNVSIIATVIAVAFLAVGLVYSHRIDVIADGVLLGGIFTLLYSMGRGLASGDEIYRFLIISVGVAVALFLGYWRFVKQVPARKK